VVGTIFHTLALGSTAFRLTHRCRRGGFWWDDSWALVSALLDVILFTCLWVRVYYIGESARISIGFTIIRLLPAGLMRRVAIAAVSAFFVMFLALLAQVGWICGSNSSWHRSRSAECRLGRSWTISKLSTDITGDIFLIVAPLRMLWKLRLPPCERRIIGIVFAMSILTTAISVVYAILVLGPDRLLERSVAQFEAAFSLMVCNLLVVATCCYRLVRRMRTNPTPAGDDMTCPSPAGLTTPTTFTLTDISISMPMALGSSSTFQTDLPDHPPGVVNPTSQPP
ncbi:hypothetical protein BD779DRAFT_1709252, partial [Infundibulicybe gibba]